MFQLGLGNVTILRSIARSDILCDQSHMFSNCRWPWYISLPWSKLVPKADVFGLAARCGMHRGWTESPWL